MIYELLSKFGPVGLNYILMGVTLLLGWALFGHISNLAYKGYAEETWREVRKAVVKTGDVYFGALTAGLADGNYDAIEKAEAKKMAIAEAKSNIGPKALKALGRIFNLDKYIGDDVDAFVAEINAAKEPAAAPEKS